MLRLKNPSVELFNARDQMFIDVPAFELELEHSLASLSKWEQIWEKPFLSSTKLTSEEIFSYINCMSLNGEVPILLLRQLTQENVAAIDTYINRKMTATTFREMPGRGSNQIITAELIYYWMIEANVPFEWDQKHLNQLITLIKVVGNMRSPKKKMSKRDALAQQRALNQKRRLGSGTSG